MHSYNHIKLTNYYGQPGKGDLKGSVAGNEGSQLSETLLPTTSNPNLS